MDRTREKQEENYSFSDGELREAAVKVMHALADALPEDPEPEHEFSERFQAKMKALLMKSRVKRAVKSFARSAAAVLLMALMAAGIWLAFDEEARADFFQWVRDEYESGIVYKFFERREEKTLPRVEFGWLPEGSVESEAKINDDHGYILFNISSGEYLVLYYRYMYSETSYSITRDSNVIHEVVFVNGKVADLYIDLEKDDPNMLLWTENAEGIEYNLNGSFDEETMIKIAENIRITK